MGNANVDEVCPGGEKEGGCRKGLLALQTKRKGWDGFEVVSEGGAADYVESVGGRVFVGNERCWKTENGEGG